MYAIDIRGEKQRANITNEILIINKINMNPIYIRSTDIVWCVVISLFCDLCAKGGEKKKEFQYLVCLIWRRRKEKKINFVSCYVNNQIFSFPSPSSRVFA